MFLRLFMYNARLMLRSRDGLFWTVLYPILLASLYVAAFSSMFNFSQNKIWKAVTAVSAAHKPQHFLYVFRRYSQQGTWLDLGIFHGYENE